VKYSQLTELHIRLRAFGSWILQVYSGCAVIFLQIDRCG
jgi:hypothetical protein